MLYLNQWVFLSTCVLPNPSLFWTGLNRFKVRSQTHVNIVAQMIAV